MEIIVISAISQCVFCIRMPNYVSTECYVVVGEVVVENKVYLLFIAELDDSLCDDMNEKKG